jgi:hypothetical protein
MYTGRVVVIFKTPLMSSLIHNFYRLSSFSKIFFGGKFIAKEIGLTKKMIELPLNTVRIPHVQ